MSRFGFTGRELDRLSGLMDYRARWYDARLGRFLTVDPIGFAAGDANLYRYVLNRPTGLIDPTGMTAEPGGLPDFAGTTAATIGQAAVGVVAGAAQAVATTVTGIADLAWFAFDAAVFAGNAALYKVTKDLGELTGSETLKGLSQGFHAESLGKLNGAFVDCGDPFMDFARGIGRTTRAISPIKGLTQRWNEQVDDLKKVLPPSIARAIEVGQVAGDIVGFFLDPGDVLGAVGKVVADLWEGG